MAIKLEDRLFDSDINRENYRSLLELYKNDVTNFVAFIGAGISASIKNVPEQNELYTICCKKYGHPENLEGELPARFGALYEQIENKEDFDKVLFSEVIPKSTSATLEHLQITCAFNCFVTTNYHEPIEDAFKAKQKIAKATPHGLVKYYFAFPPKEQAKHTLTYLHGNQQIGFCISRTRDYQYFYPSLYERHAGVYAIENSLSDLLTQWTVVIFGSSLETHLRKFLQYLLAKIAKENSGKLESKQKREVKMHYWITSDTGINKYLENAPKEKKKEFEEKYFNDCNKINIKPVIYTGSHIFIEDLCTTLAELCEPKLTKVAGSTYDPTQRQGDL